jgi:PAS domain S-box-containing protein
MSERLRDEIIIRPIRWAALFAAIITLPPGTPQAPVMAVIIFAGMAYNAIRYIPGLLRYKFFESKIIMIVLDIFLVTAMVVLVGRADQAYTLYLVPSIIAATYWYGVKGTVAVVMYEIFVLILISNVNLYPSVQLNEWRSLVLATVALIITGRLMEQLTHVERDERKLLEKLRDENEIEQSRLFALINSLQDAAAVVDGSGKIMLSNLAMQELVGKPTGLIGENLKRILPLRHINKAHFDWSEVFRKTIQRRRDLVLIDKAGDIDLDISVTPVNLEKIGNINFILVARDITKEKSLDQQREEFISVASHELRTPLTIIEAAVSQVLLDKKLASQHKMILDQAHRNTVFMGELVKELTTLSRAQNDSIPITIQPVNARPMLDRLVADFAAAAKEKHLALTAEVKPDTPSVLSTEHHIEEILRNFINNALKYTPKGGIEITAEPASEDGVLFKVKDTGIGISKADIKRLFTKFYRAEDYRTRETGGTGLGLYLCLELAERIDGKVWCTSTLNEGSVFHLEVPPYSHLKRDLGKVAKAEVKTLINKL